MAWNPSPEVAAARDAAKALGNAPICVVLWLDEKTQRLGMASYGRKLNRPPAARSEAMSQELHQAIMNLPCPETRLTDANSVQAIYARGHRDARHAAAELALALVPADSDEPDPAHVTDMRHLAIYGAASLARFSNWDGVSPELSRAMCSAAIAIRDKAQALSIQPTSKETTT